MFERLDDQDSKEVVSTKESQDVALKIAKKAITLLKNDNNLLSTLSTSESGHEAPEVNMIFTFSLLGKKLAVSIISFLPICDCRFL